MIDMIETYINKELIPQLNKRFDATRTGFEEIHKSFQAAADILGNFEKRIQKLEESVGIPR